MTTPPAVDTPAPAATDAEKPAPLPVPITETPPGQIAAELLDRITEQIRQHPRTLQAAVGPSEIGTPCERKLGHKIIGTPQRDLVPNWKATVGTAVHDWLAQVFDDANLEQAPEMNGHERFYVEQPLTIGTVAGQTISGTPDLYDRLTATNWDWKLPGPPVLRSMRTNGPGETYRIQAHLYGLGWENAGLPIRHVGVISLPRNGELADRYVWHEPYDRATAVDALVRFGTISSLVTRLGAVGIELLQRADDYCSSCPFYVPRISNSEAGCPGAPDADRRPNTGNRATSPVPGLIA